MTFDPKVFDKLISDTKNSPEEIADERDKELKDVREKLLKDSTQFWDVVGTFSNEPLTKENAVMIAQILMVGIHLGVEYGKEASKAEASGDDIDHTDTTRCVN